MYDPEAKYIIKWVPELKKVPFKDILNWETLYKKYTVYTEPIVNIRDTTIFAKNYLKSFYKQKM